MIRSTYSATDTDPSIALFQDSRESFRSETENKENFDGKQPQRRPSKLTINNLSQTIKLETSHPRVLSYRERNAGVFRFSNSEELRRCGGGGGGGGGECCRVGEVVQHVGHLVLVWLLALVGVWGVGVGGGGVGGVPGGVGGFRWIGLEDWVVVGVAVCWLILGVGVGGRVDGLAGGVGDRRRLGVGVGGESVPVAIPCQPTRHRQNNNFTSPCWASESAAGAASVQWRQERRRTVSWWRWRVMLVAASSPAN